MKHYSTSFEHERESEFVSDSVRVVTAHARADCKHAYVPSIKKHSSGQLLLACRWDGTGDAEGDDTNEQALFFSKDDGVSWTMANDGKPILTLDLGSSFERASSITHSFVFEDQQERTWMYYTINQPYTWGRGKPNRSTGGGEIRKIRIVYEEGTWRTSGPSLIVWGFMQPIDDGRGGHWTNVRALSLNGILRTSRGSLLMPIAGRTTAAEPCGAFWKLNRVWMLESVDDGRTWSKTYFVGGHDGLCLCEPAIVETAGGQLVCYMRVQYHTGNQLYRSDSLDFGHTWTSPRPVGLPNTSVSGTKPFVTRLLNGDYLLLQTNEHDTTSRTNISVFRTDEAGLSRDYWPQVKVLNLECRSHWAGVSYGWLEPADATSFYAVYAGFDADASYIHFAKLDVAWLETTVVEPNAGRFGGLRHVPQLTSGRSYSGNRAMYFSSTAGRLIATRFAELTKEAVKQLELGMHVYVEALPAAAEFAFFHLGSRNGSQPSWKLSICPSVNQNLWISTMEGLLDTGIACPTEQWVGLILQIRQDFSVSLRMNGIQVLDHVKPYIHSSDFPDTWKMGSTDGITHDACKIYMDDIYYKAQALHEGDER